MLDITPVYRTLVPSYPLTVKPGGKEVLATVRISPADGVTSDEISIIPGKDRAASVFMVSDGKVCEILCERKAGGFARKHGLELPVLPVDYSLASLSMSGGKDPRWTYGKGNDRATAHKTEMSAGLLGLHAFIRRIGAV